MILPNSLALCRTLLELEQGARCRTKTSFQCPEDSAVDMALVGRETEIEQQPWFVLKLIEAVLVPFLFIRMPTQGPIRKVAQGEPQYWSRLGAAWR